MLTRRGLVLLARAGRRDFSAAATTGLPGSGVFDFLGAETASAPATTLMTGSAGSDVWRTAVEAQFGGSVGETWGAPIGADGEGGSLLESLFDPIALIKRTFQPSFLRRKRVSSGSRGGSLCVFAVVKGRASGQRRPPCFSARRPPTYSASRSRRVGPLLPRGQSARLSVDSTLWRPSIIIALGPPPPYTYRPAPSSCVTPIPPPRVPSVPRH
jgi:hypothetical protein